MNISEQQHQQQHQHEQQHEQQQAVVHQHQHEGQGRCARCGAPLSPGARFCEECGEPVGVGACPYCGADVKPNHVICPVCGHSLGRDFCTFCGAHMEPDEQFCPECGNSRGGIVCPDCGTLNFRSFCRKCNAPLNAMAISERERALNDPKYKHALGLAQELAQMEAEILEMAEQLAAEQHGGAAAKAEPILTEDDMKLIEEYRKMLGTVQPPSPTSPSDEGGTSPSPAAPQRKERTKAKLSMVSIEEAMHAYRAKAAEMQAALDAMVPDAEATPEEQRNYYSARRMPVERKVKKTIQECEGWICNLCGCLHNKPQECAEPELGGRWIYKTYTVEEIVKTYELHE